MLDFRPDRDPRTPGYLAFVSEMVPVDKGYRSSRAEVDYGPPFTYTLIADEVYPNKCFASRWNSVAGGIVIVGTNKKLNVLNSTTGYINVSKAGNYSLSGQAHQFGEDALAAFDLCAFGDVIIAVNKSAPSQKRNALDLTGATLFSDLGGATAAPQGNTCCVAANFVFIGNCGNWSTVTGSADILAWSAIGDHTDWRVNPQVTQSSYAQFVDTPGAITAVRPFRDGIIVFKATSMYRGRYVGAGPNSPIWDFERISDKIGCVGHRSVTNIEQALVFVGWRDVYMYEGTRPQSITDGIFSLIQTDLFVGSSRVPLLLGHNQHTNEVWLSGYTRSFIWNYRLNRWGMLSSTQTAQPVPCDTNVDNLSVITVTSVSGGLPTVSTTDDHINLYTLRIIDGVTKNRNTAATTNCYLTTGWFGQPDKLLTVQRVNPVYTLRPTTLTNVELTAYGSMTPSDGTALGTAKLNASFRFDTLGPTPNGTIAGSSQNFFTFRIDSRDYVEIVDVVPKLVAAGER